MAKKSSSGSRIDLMLSASDKGVSRTTGVGGVLASLFRKMLLDLGINGQKWGHLMYRTVTENQTDAQNNRRDQTSMRGNLTKEFGKPQMTWKVFCKAMRFLRFTKFEIAIKAYHEDGKTSIHSTTVDFGSKNPQRLEHVPHLDQEKLSPDTDEDQDDEADDE